MISLNMRRRHLNESLRLWQGIASGKDAIAAKIYTVISGA
jgi:hypothetical protein